MKTYIIRLKDKTQMRIFAKSYRKDGDRYVFDGTESGEIEFVLAESVVGISVEPPRGGGITPISFG
ncbi:MAG: hypothetical protein P4L87_16810 [Formivibrio sp.]|nr:hypothetical protein [Formivibrio sp.]